MNDEDMKKIGEEFERILQPVYGDLDVIKEDVKEMREDVNALKVEVHDTHLQIGGLRNETSAFKDKAKDESKKLKST